MFLFFHLSIAELCEVSKLTESPDIKMSDSEGEVLVAEEATPESLTDQTSSDITNQPHSSTTTQSCQSSQETGALSGERTDSHDSAATAGADVTSVSRRAEINQQGTTTRVSGRTVTSIHESRGDHTLAQGAGASSHRSSAANTTPCTSTPTTDRAENSTAPTAGSASSAGGGPHSTSTPLGGQTQRYPSQLTRNYNQDREYSEQEEEEDCDWEEVERMGNVAGSILGYSPLVFENNEEEGDDHLDELYVPISGYEVMEQRSKFTVSMISCQLI